MAFNELDLPLVIVGEGKEEKYLKKIAGNNIKFMGFQPDEELDAIYAGARAFIFPGIDDFGLAPAEAMAHGIPVIAGKYGGALEMVEAGKNGEFFESASPDAIVDGVKRFIENEGKYDREYIIKSVERFGKERFKKEIEEFITNSISN